MTGPEMVRRASNSSNVSHYEQQGITQYKQDSKLHLHHSSPHSPHLQYQAKCTSLNATAVLVVFLARRLVIGFVLGLVKFASASLDRLHGLFLVAGT
jgi:hypothetical protein